MFERVLVTGGTGFVGSNVVPKLIADGSQVDILARNESSNTPKKASLTLGDVRNLNSLPTFEPYDLVIHLAGIVSIQQSVENPTTTFQTNSLGTQNVLERARAGGVDRFIYLSSGAVYGNPDYLPIDESHPTQCLHPYASSKLAGEHVVEAYANTYDLSAITLRAFTLYGPEQQTDNLVPSVISQIMKGKTEISLGNTGPTRDFTYIEDLVAAIQTVKAEPLDAYELYNVGSGHETSVIEIVEEIIEATEKDIEITSHQSGRSSDIEINRMVADIRKLEQLGWTPNHDIESGIQKTFARFNNG